MYFYKYTCIVFVILLSFSKMFFGEERSVLYFKNSERDGNICQPWDFAVSFDNVDRVKQCLSMCAIHKCARVFYYPMSESCHGCTSLFPWPLPESEGSLHYEISFECSEGRYNTSCYQVSSSPLTWNAAKSYCQSINGYLATMETENENNYVTTWLQGQYLAWLDTFVHIGVTDSVSEGEWLNVRGGAQVYKSWAPLQPDNGLLFQNEHCVAIDMIVGGWNDLPCSQAHRAVCEIEMI